MPAEPGEPQVDHARSDGIERVVNALRDPTRRRILLALIRDGRPRSIDELAQLADVHRTVAFGHAERLVDLGYLDKSRRRGRVGKPASLYSVRVGLLSLTYPARQFAVLAGLLGTGLSSLGTRGRAAARATGVEFGEALAHPGAASSAHALVPLQHLGAEYAVDGDRITAANCVFLEACNDARDVVCGLHAGILEGALHRAGVNVQVEPLGPVSPRSCAFVAGMARVATTDVGSPPN